MNGIQIQIIGAVGSGKTRVAQEIVDILREKGLAVKWDVSPDYKSEIDTRMDGNNRLQALESISNKSTIIVKEIQAHKDFNAALNYRVQGYINKEE
jgi:uridine kinase